MHGKVALSFSVLLVICVLLYVSTNSWRSQWPEDVLNSVEWVFTGVIVAAYTSVLHFGFTHPWTKSVLTGRWAVGVTTEADPPPMGLPFVGLIWSVATAIGFVVWKTLAGSVSLPSKHAYFMFGWHENLVVFNVRIDVFWKYSILIIYQITRSVLLSMINAVYKPWLSDIRKNKSWEELCDSKDEPHDNDNARKSRKIKFMITVISGQLCVSIVTWWSNITDIMLGVSQVDLALYMLFAASFTDAAIAYEQMDNNAKACKEEKNQDFLETSSQQKLPSDSHQDSKPLTLDVRGRITIAGNGK